MFYYATVEYEYVCHSAIVEYYYVYYYATVEYDYVCY